MDSSGGGSTSSNNSIMRWNPTKDQVSILEGLYGQGMRTPTADQIQRITSRLRAYGHIEGKNVFYWFQNHKARQRQRQKEKELQQQQQQSSCLSFSYMNRRFLYFHNSRATTPGLIYRTAPSPSSTNVVFRPYYVAQNQTAGDNHEQLLPSGSNRRRKVTDDDNDRKDKLKLSLTTATPFETEFLVNNSKSTLDLFPIYPSGIDEQDPRMISLGEEEYCSSYMENCGRGDMPFFDFLSVNGCCGHD